LHWSESSILIKRLAYDFCVNVRRVCLQETTLDMFSAGNAQSFLYNPTLRSYLL